MIPFRAPLAALLLLAAASRGQAQEAGAGLVHQPFPVRLVFTGDINLGTRTLPDGLPPDSGRGLFRGVDSLLRGDLVVGNFEGALSDSGWSTKCGPPPDTTAADSTRRVRKRPATATRTPPPTCYAFATPSWLAPRMPAAGFTHLNFANNHANDYGAEGRWYTEEVYRQLGITTYGPLGEVAITPVVRDGRFMLVGLIGFATYPHSYNLLDLPHSVAIVDSVRPLVDILVVTFHGGQEGSRAVRTPVGPEFLGREPRGNLRRWARAVIDAGADAVVGHGPHVLRGVEFHRGRPVFYSLGNFLTWRGFNLEGPLGLTTALRLDLNADGGFRAARMPPLIQRPGVGPEPDPAGGAVALLRRVTRLDFPRTGARFADDGSVTAPR